MKKYLLLNIVLFLLGVCLYAQPVSKAIALHKKGQQFMQRGMFLEAIAAYKNAIAADKKYDSSHLSLAKLYLTISKTDSAVKTLKSAIKAKPTFAAANEMMGMIYRDYIKNSSEAIIYYTAAAKYDSTNKAIWYSLAWCSNDLKKYDNAISYAIKALDIDNTYRPGYNELAHAYRRLGNYTEAIAAFKKRLDISVTDQPLYYSGLCYIELKDKDGATRMYNELVKLQSKAAEALKKRIDALPQ